MKINTRNLKKKALRYSVVSLAIITSSSIAFSALSIFFTGQTEAAAVPSVSASLPSESLLGEDFSFNVSFNNSGADTGYGPFIDLIFPNTGADGIFPFGPGDEADGLSFVSATYLGSSVTSIVQEFPDDGLGTGCVDHPYAVTAPNTPLSICGTAGDTLVTLQLPFGSFTDLQPTADVTVNVSMSENADLSTALDVQARGGFQFGEDPLDNPTSDPSITETFSTSSLTPTLFSISKSYIGPESETATGPNFPRQYTITADIADGQTIDDFDLIDYLPDNIEYLQVDSVSPGTCSTNTEPSTPGAQNPPNNELRITCTSVTGGTGSNDASVTFSFFVPYEDANSSLIISETTGNDTTSVNDAAAEGTWDPIDTRDLPTPVSSDITSNDHTLTDKSIAIQKSVSVFQDNNSPGNSPGDVLEYTYSFQISDFFSFTDIVSTDVISDGQRFDDTFTPTLSLTEHGSTSSGNFDLANYEVLSNYTPADPAPNDGTTTIIFNISDELVTRALDANVLGGCIEQTGTVTPDCDSFNDGATTGTVTYRTIIQESFSDDFPSGDPSVDQGDTLTNDVSIEGSVLDNSSFSPTGSTEADESSASVGIERGSISKTIYAINGNTSFTPPVQVAPGDSITFRVEFTLPTSDFEEVSFDDFFPLPVFQVDDPDADEVIGPAWTFDSTSPTDGGYTSSPPAAGVVKFGPTDTLYDITVGVLGSPGLVPTLSTTTSANQLTIDYGDFDDPSTQSSQIDLLFTINAADDPFADGLFLTNQIRSNEGSTNLSSEVADSIIQFELTQPDIQITKGVVATNGESPVYDPDPFSPVSFSAPGGGCQRFTGTVSSNALDTTEINSDISDLDAGDIVTFAIVLENEGSGVNGAFDVQFKDTLEAGFQIPGSGLNLCITDGAGNSLANTPIDGTDVNPIFEDGIVLTNPSPTQGSLDSFSSTSGGNIAVITYDLELTTSVEPEEVITNTADIFNYAGVENGDNHMVEPRFDTAEVTTLTPLVDKTIDSTNQAHTSGNNVAIGEIITYEVELTIPEGTLTSAIVNDALDTGLAFVSCSSIVASAGLSTSIGTFGDVCSNSTAINSGEDITFDFGTLTNSDTDNLTDETITITYDVVVLNTAANVRNQNRNNDAELSWSLGQVSDNAPNVTIREPDLQVSKSASPTSADASDTVQYSVTISHTGNSDLNAYNVSFDDVIPSDLTYTAATFNFSCSAGVITPPVLNDTGAPTLIATIDELPLGEDCTLTYDVTLDNTVFTGQTIDNDAEVEWTSLPGDITTAQSTFNTNSTERTGNTGDPGGSANDYFTEDSATINVFEPFPNKSIVSTSEAHSTNVAGTERVAIGEIVRYRLEARVAEGITPDFKFRDRLPDGMQFLNDGTSFVAFISNAATTTSTTLTPGGLGCTGGANPDLNFTGNEANVDSFTPECELPDDAISSNSTSNSDSYSSGTDIYFKFGDITNDDRDADNEYIVVEFNALVLNESGNQSGITLNNRFQGYVGISTVGSNSSNVSVIVAEPELDISKSVTTTPLDAGDTIEYQIVVTNTSTGNNALNAYDVNVLDSIDSDVILSSVTPSASGSGVVTDNSNIPGNLVDVSISFLEPGETLTIDLSGTVDNAVLVGTTIPNTADLTYTSLPGTGTTSNPTGSNIPGNSGDGDGERDGSGFLINDYNDSDSAPVTLESSTTTKSLVTTSETYTAGSEVTIGETVTYEIEVIVPEGSITSLEVVDNIPNGMQYVSGSGTVDSTGFNGTVPSPTISGGASSGNPVTFSFGAFSVPVDGNPSNNTFTIQLEADVLDVVGNDGLPPGQTDLVNNAEITVNSGTPSISNDVTTTVVEPEITITKNFNPDQAPVNDSIEVTITIENTGTSDAFEIDLEDPLPSGLTFDGNLTHDSGVAPDTLSESGGTITASWATLAVGDTSTITFDVTIDTGQSRGDVITNTATINQYSSIDGSNPNERTTNDIDAQDDLTITAPDLEITKSNGVNSVTPGSTTVYSLFIENVGDFQADNVEITDTVPDYGTFNNGSSSPGWTCLPDNSSGSTCTYSVGTLTDGANTTIDFAVDIDSNIPSGIDNFTNTADVSDDGTHGDDPTPGNNTSTDTDPLDAAPDLEITKDDGGATALPGDTVSYTLDYTNSGNQDATGVEITDNVPTGTTFNSATSTSGWACVPDNNEGSTCTFSIGDLDAGDSGSITFAVDLDTTLPSGYDEIDNTASISDDGTNGADPTPANNDDPDTTPVTAAPDLQVSKGDSNVTVPPGDPITYTIDYSNVGSQDATGVVLTDVVPDNTTFNPGSSTPGWSCVPDNNDGSTCTFSIGDLDVGDSGSVDFVVDTDAVFPGGVNDVTNNVTISDDGTNGTDENPGDNSDSEVTPVIAGPDLVVTKNDSGIDVFNGEQIVYNIFYENAGNQTSTNVILTETVPEYTTFDSGSSTPGWICAPDDTAGSTCTYSVGTLNPSDTGSALFVVTVNSSMPESVNQIDNTISISDDWASGPDLTPGNNSDDEDTPVRREIDLSIVKDDGLTIVNAGQTIIYTLSIENKGNTTANNVLIEDFTPEFTSFNSSDSTPGWSCSTTDEEPDQLCVFDYGSLGAGETDEVLFAVDVDNSLPAREDQIYNAASINYDEEYGPDFNPDDNQDTDTDDIDAKPNLGIDKEPQVEEIGYGETLLYTLNYGNGGDMDAEDAVITEYVPQNTTFNSSLSTPGWICDPNGNAGSVCAFPLGYLEVGESGDVVFAVDVRELNDSLIETIDNQVYISYKYSDEEDDDDNEDFTETPVVYSNVFDPPTGKKVFNEVGLPELEWKQVWMNDGNTEALDVILVDTIPEGTSYVDNSFTCEPRGISITTNCMYNEISEELVWEGNIGPDPGGTDEENSENEVVLTFRITIPEDMIMVQNQACGNWDDDQDGDINDEIEFNQQPVCTDDPSTEMPIDPTVWELTAEEGEQSSETDETEETFISELLPTGFNLTNLVLIVVIIGAVASCITFGDKFKKDRRQNRKYSKYKRKK